MINVTDGPALCPNCGDEATVHELGGGDGGCEVWCVECDLWIQAAPNISREGVIWLWNQWCRSRMDSHAAGDCVEIGGSADEEEAA